MTQHSDTNLKTARRVLANEFNDGLHTFTESDEDKAPVYQLLPTGQRANRVFVVGTYTETEDKTDKYVRARVVDPTGTFMLYAGQYQRDAKAEIESLTPPTYVAVVGKPNVYTSGKRAHTTRNTHSFLSLSAPFGILRRFTAAASVAPSRARRRV